MREDANDSGILMLQGPSSVHSPTVPLPTHNLLFSDGVLTAWDGV